MKKLQCRNNNRLCTKGILVGLVTLLTCPGIVSAQFFDFFNPKVSVSITHPPGFGLSVSRIAFAQTQGECADQIVDSLTQLFVENNVEVIDRQHLDAILAEHNFSISGYVDKQSAAQLGKILGPATLAFVKVLRCATEKTSLYDDRQDADKRWHRTHISRTQTFLKVSIQMVDLVTARILKARVFESNPSAENKSESGSPEFPSEFEVLDTAIHNIVHSQLRKMYFPWQETVELYYYDDKDCNMRLAYNTLKGGDKEGALRQSLENIETCKQNPKAKPKHIGRAYYNAGMSYFILNDYDHALEMLREANKLYPYSIVTEAIAACESAKKEAAAMQEFEEKMAVEAEMAAKASRQPTPAAEGSGSEGGKKGGSSTKASESPGAVPKGTPQERLKQLEELYRQGLISKQEYEKKRAEILKEL